MDYQSKQTQTTPTSEDNLPINFCENSIENGHEAENLSPLESTSLTNRSDRNSTVPIDQNDELESSPITSSNEIESTSTPSNSGMETESTPEPSRTNSGSTPSSNEGLLAPKPSLSTFTSFNSAKTFNGISWPSSSLWVDGPRRSAFQPYKPTTVLTNLQRGNIQTLTPEVNVNGVSWFEKAGRGNITKQDIKNARNIDEVDDNGLTALMWSSAYGQTASVELLIDNFADIHIQGNHLETALHLAAAGGHHDIIRVLVMNGGDVNAEDEDGNSPLLYAVFGDHAHAVSELIESGCDLWEPNNLDVKAYNLAVEQNCVQARTVIEEYLKHLISRLG